MIIASMKWHKRYAFFAPFSANIDGISRHNLLKRIQTKSTPSSNACLFCASCACRGNVATWQSPFLEQSARDYFSTWRRFFPAVPAPSHHRQRGFKKLQENVALCFELFLCLSRACLGKMMHFIYKRLKTVDKSAVFSPLQSPRSPREPFVGL
jgi:hypothetical protein